MSEKKLYAVGCHTPEGWAYVHKILMQDGTLEDNIPSRSVEVSDLQEHSETRAVYLLTDEEASQLIAHPAVKFVNVNYASYPEEFKPPPEQLQCVYRYAEAEKQYRNFADTNTLPTSPNASDINRSGYQLLRCMQKDDPWFGKSAAAVIDNRLTYAGDGSDVDVIVGDDGTWFGHAEFQNNTGNGPVGYIGGNLLPGNGTCDLLDLVLDAPYYIDPDWFNADPTTRLTTRWDGTVVPVESVARLWWTNGAQRSTKFVSIGTVPITSGYTRAFNNGTPTVKPSVGNHGTACAGLAYGRTQGWAFNANKWALNVYNTNGSDIEQYFDIMKLFHLYKPINPKYGTKDPTISSNSWGYRATQGTTGWYYFRVGTSGAGGIQYTTKPAFMVDLGRYGDGLRFKGEMPNNSYTVAGEEMIQAGVIFVVAAGNSNQKQVSYDHPDFNNYWAANSGTPLTSATHSEFGLTAYNTTNRRGFPQQLGKYTDGGAIIYPAINIGALDDAYQISGLERKVNYSDMGNEIDVFAPADGTLAANRSYATQYPRADTYAGAGATIYYDTKFSGTSAACPVSTGFIATLLQYNRSWTWQDVRNYFKNKVNVQSTSTFYHGVDSQTATAASWADVVSLEGAPARVLYDAPTVDTVLRGTELTVSGVTITFS
jgi:hypothetical protein